MMVPVAVGVVAKDVGRCKAHLKEMLVKSGRHRSVALMDVPGTILRGFNRRAVAAALGR